MFNGLEPMCRDSDETTFGINSAERDRGSEDFDQFANQCAKYGYRVPSKEKFTESYNQTKALICSDARKYFISSYKKYGQVVQCASDQTMTFQPETIRQDVSLTRQYKDEIEYLDQKISKTKGAPKKTYDKDFLVDGTFRAIYESNPETLENERKATVEKLKPILSKYNLFISDLDSL